MKKIAFLMAVIALLFIAGNSFASTKLSIASQRGGLIDGAIQQSDVIDVRVLAASVAESHTVPTGANYVLFSCVTSSGDSATFWCDLGGGTAAIPSGDITNGSGCEANPVLRYIGGVSTISLIAPADCIVIMMFYE